MNKIDELIVKNTFNNIIDGKLIIPDNIKQIKFDVGLAGEAPNAAIWISETPDRFVIGIEPIPYHWGMLHNFETSNSLRPYPHNFKIIQLEEGVVKLNRNIVGKIDNRFCGLECAIDDVDGIQRRVFYQTNRKGGASGSSSLLKPINKHPMVNDVEDIYEVNTISLSSILDYIPWDRFEYIEHIKTDCEGYDYTVVKSMGKYLNKIVFISSELLRRDWWENKTPDKEFVRFMLDNNFSVISEKGGEINFVNEKLKHKINEHSLNNKTL